MDREANLLRSVTETTWRFYLWVGFLCSVLLWGAYAYIQQVRYGLIVTGLRDQFSWGLYIANFVFFIGISHAGTLISAILRVTHTEWRRPITRMAEAITVFALCIGAPMVIIDLGRPDRLWNVVRYGRIQSPILWDVLSVSTYLIGCVLFFYLPLIPDLAVLAEQPQLPSWRRRLYRFLSLGWKGSKEEKRQLEKAISVMAIMIIPLAVSVHTVVSWIFAMTLRPGWDSSIFGPYFVIGAIYSGAAAVIVSMDILRRLFKLQDYVTPLHFRNLGILLLTFALLYLYFNINEYLTVGYKFPGPEKALLDRLLFGDFALYFWGVQSVGVLFPLLLLIALLTLRRYRQFVIPGVALASFLVVAGAWAKRYLIVVPTLASPYLPAQRLPWEWTHYKPSWVEWSITAAAFAGFLLIYTILSKLFPIVSIWETREGAATEQEQVEHVVPSPRWPSITSIGALFIGAILLAAVPAEAQSPRGGGTPKATTLTVEWQVVPETAPKAPAEEPQLERKGSARVFLFSGRLLGLGPLGAGGHHEEDGPAPTIAVTARLQDDRGAPLAFQPVSFSLNTSFGTLRYGNRPTDDKGTAQLLIRERRYGRYPVQVTYQGEGTLAPSRGEVLMDFGVRPAPSLPKDSVLISPYPTAAIGLPFLFFYGLMWVVFAYAFGYLVLYRMRRAASGKEPRAP